MTDAQAKAFPFNPFDLTKVWPKVTFRLIESDISSSPESLKRLRRVEQAAFSPANIVPASAIRRTRCCRRDFSPMESAALPPGGQSPPHPVNAPKMPVPQLDRDGAMRTDGNSAGTPTYFPNSRGEWIDLDAAQTSRRWKSKVGGALGPSYRRRSLAAAGRLFRNDSCQQTNAVRQYGSPGRRRRQAHSGAAYRQLHQADPAYGAGVAKALGIKPQMIAAE